MCAYRQTFSHLGHSTRYGGWFMDQRTGEDEWTMVPVSSLVGRKVNIADKDGGVWEGVTVTQFDERTGCLTLEGGVTGPGYRPEEARPMVGPASVAVHDVARGFINGDG